jgi:hypothetical protein
MAPWARDASPWAVIDNIKVCAYIPGSAAYLAGSKLSSSQVIIVSLVYVFSAIAWGLVNITHAHSLETLVAAHTNFVPSPFFLLPWSLLSGTAWFSCLIAILYFMYDIRSNSVKN